MDELQFLVIELHTQTASFRDPEFQNFHRSLKLPPPTTIFGLAGAALGLGPKASQEFFIGKGWYLGVYGNASGKAKDLWKYRTFDKDEAKSSGIVHREWLIGNRFIVVFGNVSKASIDQLKNAFEYPVFALTMGSSDSLAKVSKLVCVSKTVVSRKIAHCLVEGNIVSEVLERAFESPEFSIYTTSDPIAQDLPLSFEYKSEYGVRAVSSRKTLSFIGNEMMVNLDITGVAYQDVFIPIFQIP